MTKELDAHASMNSITHLTQLHFFINRNYSNSSWKLISNPNFLHEPIMKITYEYEVPIGRPPLCF